MRGSEYLPGRPFPAERPVVFHFQPASFFVFTDDKLEIWEEWMRKHVGLPLPEGIARRLVQAGHTCTGTGTGDAGADDCD